MILRKRPGQDWLPIVGTQFLRYLDDDDRVRLVLGDVISVPVGFDRVFLYRADGRKTSQYVVGAGK